MFDFALRASPPTPNTHNTPPPSGLYNPASTGQVLTLGSMFYFPTVPATGFVMYSTVFADDPTHFVLVAASIMDEYFDTVFDKSADVAVVRWAVVVACCCCCVAAALLLRCGCCCCCCCCWFVYRIFV